MITLRAKENFPVNRIIITIMNMVKGGVFPLFSTLGQWKTKKKVFSEEFTVHNM